MRPLSSRLRGRIYFEQENYKLVELLTRENLVYAFRHITQICLIATIQFDRQPARIANLANRLADFLPVNAAFAQVDEVARLGVEIFQVKFGDTFAQGANPLLREAVHHDVADIEIRLDPGT